MLSATSRFSMLAGMIAAGFFLLSNDIAFGQDSTEKLLESIGNNNLEIIEKANVVTMLLVIDNHKKGKLHEIHLSEEQISRLKKNLLNDRNYDFSMGKYCRFLPEISFKLQTQDGKELHLFASLSCHQLLIGAGSKSTVLNYAPVEERLGHLFSELIREGREKNKPSWKS